MQLSTILHYILWALVIRVHAFPSPSNLRDTWEVETPEESYEDTAEIQERSDPRRRPLYSAGDPNPRPATVHMNTYAYGRWRDTYPVSDALGGCSLVIIYNNIGWIGTHIRPGPGSDRRVEEHLSTLIHNHFGAHNIQTQTFIPAQGDRTTVLPGYNAYLFYDKTDWGDLVLRSLRAMAPGRIDRIQAQRYDAGSFVFQGYAVEFSLRWMWRHDFERRQTQQTIQGIAYPKLTSGKLILLGPGQPRFPNPSRESSSVTLSNGQTRTFRVDVLRVPWVVGLAPETCLIGWQNG